MVCDNLLIQYDCMVRERAFKCATIHTHILYSYCKFSIVNQSSLCSLVMVLLPSTVYVCITAYIEDIESAKGEERERERNRKPMRSMKIEQVRDFIT